MKKWVTVIWDSMLDKYVFWDISRLNPEEHGAPLMLAESEEYRLWWAANVAANLANMWLETNLISITGDDMQSTILKNLVEKNTISLFTTIHTNPTIVKERYMYHGRQIMRVDKEKFFDLSMGNIQEILNYVQDNLTEIIVFSDYGKWIANAELLEKIKVLAAEKGVKIIADVKPKNINKFHNIFLIKPNFNEFCWMVGEPDMNPSNTADIEKYGRILADRLQTNLVITKGAHGASLITLAGEVFHVAATTANPIDVTGAWDSFLAWLALGIHNNLSLEEALKLGNKISWIAVSKLWTTIVHKNDLEN